MAQQQEGGSQELKVSSPEALQLLQPCQERPDPATFIFPEENSKCRRSQRPPWHQSLVINTKSARGMLQVPQSLCGGSVHA